MSITAILCAAGKGERAEQGKNKVLAPLYGTPVLWYALEKMNTYADELIVTASPTDFLEIEALAKPFNAKVVLGGSTRTESVFNALQQATGDMVLIHDGARPFVTDKIIQDCIACVKAHRSAICSTPVTDTVCVVNEDGTQKNVPDRKTLRAVQTPQGFYTTDIKTAYEKAMASDKTFTDDGSVYAEYVGAPTLFDGDVCNRKLTYKNDFDGQYPAINAQKGQAIGFGVDVHAFGKAQDYVTLCGVKIPSESGLVAHSDGDVCVHAVMDALLSTAGLKDIGHYFPDTDPKFSGADSMRLLEQVMNLVESEGFAPVDLSLTVQAERPRLAKYIDKMKENLANACHLPVERVAVSAGTCEKLGFVGKGLGITATAVVLAERK